MTKLQKTSRHFLSPDTNERAAERSGEKVSIEVQRNPVPAGPWSALGVSRHHWYAHRRRCRRSARSRRAFAEFVAIMP
jgi:hypothetical protein